MGVCGIMSSQTAHQGVNNRKAGGIGRIELTKGELFSKDVMEFLLRCIMYLARERDLGFCDLKRPHEISKIRWKCTVADIKLILKLIRTSLKETIEVLESAERVLAELKEKFESVAVLSDI